MNIHFGYSALAEESVMEAVVAGNKHLLIVSSDDWVTIVAIRALLGFSLGDFVLGIQTNDPSIVRRGVYVGIHWVNTDEKAFAAAAIIPIDGESDSFFCGIKDFAAIADSDLAPSELEFAEHIRAILPARD
ncbi:MAG: hypothetical protein KBC15_01020 [Candidatus Levybacteria bacterium]|nr:hypothetical protein [Candidatus Levybacteria bacterium]